MGNQDSQPLSPLPAGYKILKQLPEHNLTHVTHLDTDIDYLLRQYTFNHEDLYLQTMAQHRIRQSIRDQHLTHLDKLQGKEIDHLCANMYKVYALWEYPYRSMGHEIADRGAQGRKFEDKQLWSILASAILALSTLQKHKIRHQMLTTSTILLDGDGLVKIADPLTCPLLTNMQTIYRNRSTTGIYLSPQQCESLQSRTLYTDSYKSDVFILGMIMLECGLMRKQSACYRDQCQRVDFEVLGKNLGEFGREYGEELRFVVELMLRREGKDRPDWIDLEHYARKSPSAQVSAQVSAQATQNRHILTTPQSKPDQLSSFSPYLQTTEPRQPIRNPAEPIHPQLPPLQQPALTTPTFNSIPNSLIASIPAGYDTQRPQGGGIYGSFQPMLRPTEHNQSPNKGVMYSGQPETRYEINRPVTRDENVVGAGFNVRLGPVRQQQPKMQYFKTDLNLNKNQPNPNYTPTQLYNPLPPSLPTFNPTLPTTSINTFRPNFTTTTNTTTNASANINSYSSYTGSSMPSHMNSGSLFTPPSFLQQHGSLISGGAGWAGLGSGITGGYSGSKTGLNSGITGLSSGMTGLNSGVSGLSSGYGNGIGTTGLISSNIGNSYGYNNFMANKTKQPTSVPSINPLPAPAPAPANNPNTLTSQADHNNTYIDTLLQKPLPPSSNPTDKPQYVVQNFTQGSRYQGYKLRDMRHGQGKFYYQDGGLYDGSWSHNKMDGYGSLYYQSGKLAYQGMWKQDQFQGQGKLYNQNPQPLSGMFNYQNFDQIEQHWQYYEGDFVEDFKKGLGKLMLSNGEYFEGTFNGDMLEGPGAFYCRDGRVVKGMWQQNHLVELQ